MADLPMSSKEYAEAGDSMCPHCGSDQIEGASINIEGNKAYQDISCLDCEKEWTDVYTLTGYGPREGW